MAQEGVFVTVSRGDVYCRMTLDKGERIVLHHHRGSTRSRLTIERLKLLGLRSDRLFACDLDSEEGKTALRFLTRDAQAHTLDATPLGAFVKYLKTCESVDEMKVRCMALAALHRAAGK
jgi:hypothetical protein